jgi:hypothetical protein
LCREVFNGLGIQGVTLILIDALSSPCWEK